MFDSVFIKKKSMYIMQVLEIVGKNSAVRSKQIVTKLTPDLLWSSIIFFKCHFYIFNYVTLLSWGY